MLVEILLIAVIAVAVVLAVRYVVKTQKKDGCVGCSMAKQCHMNIEECPKEAEDGEEER